MSNWDKRYIELAEHVASWSKDPSTKVGAVVVAPGNRPIGFGFNGFARGCDDSPQLYADREYKHRHVIHAETNAILNARQPVDGCTVYITHPPCQHCAGTMVQSGVSKVVCRKPLPEFAKRWNINDTLNVLADGGVEIEWVE